MRRRSYRGREDPPLIEPGGGGRFSWSIEEEKRKRRLRMGWLQGPDKKKSLCRKAEGERGAIPQTHTEKPTR